MRANSKSSFIANAWDYYSAGAWARLPLLGARGVVGLNDAVMTRDFAVSTGDVRMAAITIGARRPLGGGTEAYSLVAKGSRP